MKKVALGVDIGGTQIKLVLIDQTGKIIFSDQFPTLKSGGPKKFIPYLSEHILAIFSAAKKKKWSILGVGVGAPGPIDVERGFVYSFPNLAGWENTPFKKLLEAKLQVPVFVDNDANVMALGEALFGAGRGTKHSINLTLGTGIGGGLVINGKLFHGPTYSAAEIGHMIINENGPLCACGNHGCVEAYVGNGYFVKNIKKRLADGEKSILNQWIKEGKELSPKLAALGAEKGDIFCQKLWVEAAEHLATALAGLVNLLNPEKIIIGGGIAQSGELLLAPLRQSLRKKAFPIAAASVKVVPAALGTDAGAVGAAALVFSNS